MKKRILAVLLMAIILTIPSGKVFAGLTSETGTLETDPPAGGANWTAWLVKAGFPPAEIMTEDNFNAEYGVNTGYTNDGWFMQVPNFNLFSADDGDPITMTFGGLGSQSGRHWYYTFNWAGDASFPSDPTQTIHGEVNYATLSGPRCPAHMLPVVHAGVTSKTHTFIFSGQPNTSYYVYRTTTASGAFDGEGNGRYRNPVLVLTDGNGQGVYEDTQLLPLSVNAWYTAIHLDPTGVQNGCHSELVEPTAVEFGDFKALYDYELEVMKFSWQTYSENSLVGFNIYRSDSETGLRVTINDTLIPAVKPGSIDGALYDSGQDPSLWDTEVVKGQVYYYWLEAIKSDGSSIILPTVFTPPLNFQIFVPMISH